MTMQARKTVTSAVALLAGIGLLAGPALADDYEPVQPGHSVWDDDEWSDDWWEKRAFQFEFIAEVIVDVVDPNGLAEIQLDQHNSGDVFAYTSIEGDYQREMGEEVPVTLSGDVSLDVDGEASGQLHVDGEAEGFIDIDVADGSNPDRSVKIVGIAGQPDGMSNTEGNPVGSGIAGNTGGEDPLDVTGTASGTLAVDGTASGTVELSGTAIVNNGVEDANTHMGNVLGSSTAVGNLGTIQTNAATYLDVGQENDGDYVFAWAEAYNDCFDCGDGVRDIGGNDTGEMVALATRGSDYGRRLGGVEAAVQLNATAVGNLLNVETIQVPGADDTDTGGGSDTGFASGLGGFLLNGEVEPILIADVEQKNEADIFAIATSHQNLSGYSGLGSYNGLLDGDGQAMTGVVADLTATAVGNLANISMGDGFVDLDN